MQQLRFFTPTPGDPGGQLAIPLTQSERVSIIDSIRGIALLGILLMNIPFMALPMQFDMNIALRNELSGPNYHTWWIVNGLFEGTMRGLFSLLFGAGSVLLLSRLEQKTMTITPADIYYRRMIWLLIFGVIDAFLFLWPGDILYSYALCGMFLYPFRNLRPKYLLTLSLAICLISAGKEAMRRHDDRQMKTNGTYAIQLEKNKVKLTEEQQGHKEKWERYIKDHQHDTIMKAANKRIKKVQEGSYTDLISLYAGHNVQVQTTLFYQVLIWDILAFFFLGMALFKWGVLTGQKPVTFYWWLTIIGYLVGLSMNYYILHTILQSNFDRVTIAYLEPVDLYQLKRLFMTAGHLGAIMLLYKYRIANGFLHGMARVGQMAFTNYLMQGIIGGLVFYGYGLALFGRLERYQIYYVAAGIWLFQIIFSSLWLKYFLFGPFEWAWRSLTYWQRQPFRRKQP